MSVLCPLTQGVQWVGLELTDLFIGCKESFPDAKESLLPEENTIASRKDSVESSVPK